MAGIDVSVIMPAWKSAAFIERAIASVLAQTGVSLELIIIDDASPDGTAALIAEIARSEPRIIFDQLAENMGPSGARNRAIELAQGRFIAVLDDDDVMAPGRLANMVGAAQLYEADIIVDNMRPVRFPELEAGPELFLDIAPDAPARQIRLKDYIDPATEAELGQGLGYLKPLFRKATLERFAMRYDLSLRNSEDFYFVAEMLAHDCKMMLIPEADYFYTIREGSLSYRLSVAHAQAIVSAERGFRARHAKSFDRDTAQASKRQLKQRVDYYALTKMVDGLKSYNPVKVAHTAIWHVRSVPFITRMLAKILMNKVGLTFQGLRK